jgi:hypothetical protein
LATLALAGVGASYICVFSGLGTVVQLRAPAPLRARVVSLYFLALGILYPIGATIQGPIADRLGLGPVTAGAAVALLAFVVLARTLRPDWLRALDDLDAYPHPDHPADREAAPAPAPTDHADASQTRRYRAVSPRPLPDPEVPGPGTAPTVEDQRS